MSLDNFEKSKCRSIPYAIALVNIAMFAKEEKYYKISSDTKSRGGNSTFYTQHGNVAFHKDLESPTWM